MFTGLIDHTAKIGEIAGDSSALTLSIQTRFMDLTLGESVAVDGVCLTVTELTGPGIFVCRLSSETIEKSISRGYRIGSLVNVERSLRMGDRMGGHWVTGHVDAVGNVNRITHDGDFDRIRFTYPETFSKFVLSKGSIAVNGVSLTINEVGPDFFEVMLIPHTSEQTNMGHLKQNTQVNLEFDWMNKVIVHSLEQRQERRINP